MIHRSDVGILMVTFSITSFQKTTTPIMNSAIFLNNVGTACLYKGELEQAASAFKESLREVKSVLCEVDQQMMDEDLPPKASTSTTQLSCEPSRHITPDMWMVDVAAHQGSDFLVYRAPERIHETGRSSDSMEDPRSRTRVLNRMSAAILFNLSLTHHLKAISSPSREAFNTVLKLYEHSYRLVAQEVGGDRFLAMVILNNLAHVHYRLHNLADAERLCSLLWGAVLDMEKRHTSSFEGFYSNVIHVTLRHSHSAAAA